MHIGVPFVALLRLQLVKEKCPEMVIVIVMMMVKLLIFKVQGDDDDDGNGNDIDNADEGIEAEENLQSEL